MADDRKCCGYIPLEVGVQVIGCILLVGSIVSLIANSMLLGSSPYYFAHIYGSLLAVSLIQGIAATMMLIGVAQRNRYHLLPSLIFHVLSLIIVVGVTVPNMIVLIAIGLMIPLGIMIYIWMEVFKLFQILTVEDENRNNVEASGRVLNEVPTNSETVSASAPPAYLTVSKH